MMDLDPVELRVLGCLVEKQRTTPDQYPLSLNGLRLACNQTTNRDPVVQYDETTIREALHRLSQRRFSRLASGHTSRAYKFRHLLDEALDLDPGELAVLAVLMLRGAQTPGELKQRTERLHHFAGLAAVEATLERLIARGHVAQLPRRPGQKEERYVQLLGGDPVGDADPPASHAPPVAPSFAAVATPSAPAPPAPAPSPATLPPAAEARIAQLEREVAELRAELSALRDGLGA
jgi:uncharacterized protein